MPNKRNPGPFLESFFIPDVQIEAHAKTRLEELGLMPSSPSPVAIEKYCDRRWGFPEDYTDLPPEILGCAKFSEAGLVGIVISKNLCEDNSDTGFYRTRTTIAHEIGHGEQHAKAFAEKLRHDRLQGDFFAAQGEGECRILCREEQMRRTRSDEWWEIQANRFMVSLLLPKHLLREVVENWVVTTHYGPLLGTLFGKVAKTFCVSNQMAQIAARSMYDQVVREKGQLNVTGL